MNLSSSAGSIHCWVRCNELHPVVCLEPSLVPPHVPILTTHVPHTRRSWSAPGCVCLVWSMARHYDTINAGLSGGVVVVSMSAWHAPVGVRFPDQACFIIRLNNLALNIGDCLSLCLSEDTLKSVGPFNLVSIPGEVRGRP